MAEIPVERKSGIPWWVWLLLALLAFGLLIWLFNRDDENEVAVADTTPAVVTPAETPGAIAPAADANMAAGTATGPITDIAMLVGATNLASMVGRPVQLTNVRVQDVVGDRTFWVGPDANQRAFVVLNEQPTPGQPPEGRYNVEPSQVIGINGVVRNVTDPAFGGTPIEGLPAGQQAVIHAQSLDSVQQQ